MAVTESDVFCALPWIHLCGSVDGVWGRCCVDGSMYHDEHYDNVVEPEFALNDDALGCLPQSRYAATNANRAFGMREAFNSPNMRRTRLAMLAGERVPACSYCYEREAAGGESYRQKAGDMIPDDVDLPSLLALTESDGHVPVLPTYLDIRFGNTCNLRCIMCSYPVSSRWGLDKHPTWAPAHIDPYRDDEDLWKTLQEHALSLRRIYFAGGEPFLQPGHFRLVDLLLDAGAAGGIDLTYHSNLTILPRHLFRKWSQFRGVRIGASCDGTVEVFEKIRVGAKWDVFVRNLRELKKHVEVWLAVAPQSDNILHLGEVIEFAETEGIPVDLTNFVHWPEHLSIRSLSAEQKRDAAKYLSALSAESARRGRRETARQLTMLLDFLGSPCTANDGSQRQKKG